MTTDYVDELTHRHGDYVPTSNGPVVGILADQCTEFRGIPFAGSIAGASRFRPASHPDPWSQPLFATEWPPAVPQLADPILGQNERLYHTVFGSDYTHASSESGLYLNLWTPRADHNLRPVMVFLHGGGFETGQPSRPRENGRLLSSRHDVVVVAPSHRLGVFGYLNIGESNGGSANVGMLDIVLALEWVRDNIAAFGGDPENVTIFGESGGSLKVATLLAMPRAQKLFHRAICQSGVYPLGRITNRSSVAAEDESRRVLRALLPEGGSLDELFDLPVDRILSCARNLHISWAPSVDDTTLPKPVTEAIRSGCSSEVPLLVGTDLHEMRILALSNPLPETPSQLVSALNGNINLANHYLHMDDTLGSIMERAVTDYWFRMPAIRFADVKSDHCAGAVYMYLFAWQNEDYPNIGSTHGMETPFVFMTTSAVEVVGARGDSSGLADRMAQAWTAFARFGKPHVPGLEWPTYDKHQRHTMVLDSTCHVVKDPCRSERTAWAKYAP